MEITTTKEIITKETEEVIHNNNKDKDITTNKDRCNKEPKILTKPKTNNSKDNSNNLTNFSNSSLNSKEHNNNHSNNHHNQFNLNNLNNHNNLNNKLHRHNNKYLSTKPFNSLSKEKMLS